MCENQQGQIVKCAAEKFRQFGIRSVSIDDICRELNMSKKTFYLYFRQKEDLIESVLEYSDRQISAMMVEKFADKTAVECIRIFMVALSEIKTLRDQPPFVYDLKKYYPDIKRSHDEKIVSIVRDYIIRHLQKGINEGVYRDDFDIEACASYVTLLHQSWISESFVSAYVTKERLLGFTVHSLLRSIMTDKGLVLINENNNNK